MLNRPTRLNKPHSANPRFAPVIVPPELAVTLPSGICGQLQSETTVVFSGMSLLRRKNETKIPISYSTGGGNCLRRREVIVFLGAALVAHPAWAQRHVKLRRIGFLRVGEPPPTWIASFREGLREFGLIEGQHFAIEFGLAQSTAELPGIVAELVRRKVDVLVASGTPSVVPVRDAAGTIPVVFVTVIDLIDTGLVASLSRPGGNATGITSMVADLAAKRLRLLKELLPQMSKVAILVRTGNPATAAFVREAERAAQILGVGLQVLRMGNPSELGSLLASAQGAGGLTMADDAVFTAHRKRIAELALQHRLPTLFGFREMVEAGALVSYGPRYSDLYRSAAGQVHKILNGAKPADIPVEQPIRFEVVLNMRTARALGLTIPPTILVQVDEILE